IGTTVKIADSALTEGELAWSTRIF
mgnify:CR=1